MLASSPGLPRLAPPAFQSPGRFWPLPAAPWLSSRVCRHSEWCWRIGVPLQPKGFSRPCRTPVPWSRRCAGDRGTGPWGTGPVSEPGSVASGLPPDPGEHPPFWGTEKSSGNPPASGTAAAAPSQRARERWCGRRRPSWAGTLSASLAPGKPVC